MDMADRIGIEGKLRIYRIHSGGSELRQEVKNIVTNNGLYRLLDLAATSGGIVNYYAWGSSGVQVGSVVAKVAATSGLVVQDGAKALDSYSRTTNTMTFIGKLLTSEANSPGYINEFMIASSGATAGSTLICIAAQSFSNETKDSTFELQFEHSITLSNV